MVHYCIDRISFGRVQRATQKHETCLKQRQEWYDTIDREILHEKPDIYIKQKRDRVIAFLKKNKDIYDIAVICRLRVSTVQKIKTHYNL